MEEKINSKKEFYVTKNPGNKQTRGEVLIRIRDKNAFFKERKAQITEVIRGLIVSEKMQDPVKDLNAEVLQNWMKRNPDKFFGLTNADSMLHTYFFSNMKNLKFVLGLIKDY